MIPTFQTTFLPTFRPPLQTPPHTSHPPPTPLTPLRHPPTLVTTNPPTPTTTPSQTPHPTTTTTPTPTHKPPKLYDVIVIGGGPAGLSLSSNLGRHGLHTLCIDSTLHKPWPNNYGVWVDELEAIGLGDCVGVTWENVVAYVGDGDEEVMLGRQYGRVDKGRLKRRLLEGCLDSGVVEVVEGVVGGVVDVDDRDGVGGDDGGGGASLVRWDGEGVVGRERLGRVVVDATGHKLAFVRFGKGKVPGFQAAYGIECEVEGEEGERKEMVFMDFRDEHMRREGEGEFSRVVPTFLYVMPLGGKKVFFEETSLVASPPVGFEELKRRLYRRLEFNGVKVNKVFEEEFCLIPMGGEMPCLRQRVVAFGGAAAFVHPATGYMIARALKLSENAARIIAEEVERGKADTADQVSHRIWDRLWNIGRRRQRDFFNFGGEYISKIDLHTTRDFFSAFFRLPQDQWSDFLSFRLMKPLERLRFGLGVYGRTTNRVRWSIVADAINNGRLSLIRSLLPLYEVEDET